MMFLAQTSDSGRKTKWNEIICVAQFDQDPGKEQKLGELKAKSSYQRDDYVKEQGWATLPGEEKPDSKVADACAKLLMRIGQ